MALDDTIAILSQTPLIGLLERDALRLIAFTADTRRLRPSEVLFRQGERSDGGYVVVEGEIAAGRSGSDELTLVGPGSLIGRLALFLRIQRPASAIARSRSYLVRISPTLMRRVLVEFPSAAVAIRDAVAEDLEALGGDLAKVQALFESIDAG